ncbi:MAG: aminotransferase class III-fold pyridoxal phosphate-dependent enzyme [Candidatus Niyogibacteria bacterium]|nr:aminotransferase class III-fold pyridoxal phosphate-dependent enzyme [Candidatus Niyogibacteria bacterium]
MVLLAKAALSEEWIGRAKKVLATTTIHSTFVPVRGEGVYLWDADGRRVMDFTSLVGVCNLGHGSYVQHIRDAVRAHEDKTGLSHTMTHDWVNRWAVELAEKLIAIAPGDYPKKVFFSNSGTEANEAALKLLLSARPEQTRFLVFPYAFHGRTFGSNALMGGRTIRTRFFPRPITAQAIPFPREKQRNTGNGVSQMERWTPEHYMELVEEIVEPFHEEVNALFIEPEQGEGGMNPSELEFLLPLAYYCKERDIKIVDDEIQTGIGRAGKMLACEYFPGFIPDIVTLAKSICAGTHVLGVTIFDARLDFTELGRHSNTFGGNSSACRAAFETIKSVEEILDRMKGVIHSPITHLRKRLNDATKAINHKCAAKHYAMRLANLRGLGWMLGLDVFISDRNGSDVPDPHLRDQIVACAEQNGLLLLGCGKSAIRFMPPIVITNDEIDEAMHIFENLPVWD